MSATTLISVLVALLYIGFAIDMERPVGNGARISWRLVIWPIAVTWSILAFVTATDHVGFMTRGVFLAGAISCVCLARLWIWMRFTK